jgi:hypothetical protein
MHVVDEEPYQRHRVLVRAMPFSAEEIALSMVDYDLEGSSAVIAAGSARPSETEA